MWWWLLWWQLLWWQCRMPMGRWWLLSISNVIKTESFLKLQCGGDSFDDNYCDNNTEYKCEGGDCCNTTKCRTDLSLTMIVTTKQNVNEMVENGHLVDLIRIFVQIFCFFCQNLLFGFILVVSSLFCLRHVCHQLSEK